MQESNILKRYNFNTFKALPPPQNDSFFWNKNKWNDIKEINGQI